MLFECREILPPQEKQDGSVNCAVGKEAELRRLTTMRLTGEASVRRLVLWQLYGEPAETAFVFLLKRNRCVAVKRLCTKGVRRGESYVDYVRALLKRQGGGSFLVAHNHANGDFSPSPHDLVLTEAMAALAEEFSRGRVAFLGHYITNGFRIRKIQL